jgi:hypothetical protein
LRSPRWSTAITPAPRTTSTVMTNAVVRARRSTATRRRIADPLTWSPSPGCHAGGCWVGWVGWDWVGWVGADMVGTAFLLARSSAVLWTSTARPRRPGHELSSRPKNQTTRRSRSAPTASSGPATGRSPLLGVGGLPQGRVRLWRAVAQPPRQRCGPGRRRRRTTAGPRTARPGRIGWQVLVMLARAADRARVTKQYELVCKAEISPFARKGTSGVRGPAASGASQRWPACRVRVEPDPGQDLAGQLGLLLGGDQQHVGQDRVGPSSRGPYRSQVGSSTR